MGSSPSTIAEFETARGKPVYSSDGEKIGKVEELFVDDYSGGPAWLGLGTGFFGMKRVLVPAERVEVGADGVVVPYTKEHVKHAPDMDAGEIDGGTEEALYAHYGLGPTPEQPLDSGLAASSRPADTAGDRESGDAAVTRSEEELRVGKREVESGRLRLHKWVETEQVEVPVEVRREKARVTREAVDGTVPADELGDEDLVVTLREERPVVAKETVAKERIRIDKETETATETVSDKLRKERVDVEGEDVPA